MVPNGITHELVRNDMDGVDAMLRWLAFVPQSVHGLPPRVFSTDPIDRDVVVCPTKEPYDPRHILAGLRGSDGTFRPGLFDEGSFCEYMAGWGKTVVVGRARLGGMPVGCIAVETRTVERRVPADPADSSSQGVTEQQAGQVWYPDSAYKTAQAIRDFNRGENLPLIIFANWRGFSGGTRDMFAEILKYGAMIVDALVDYKHPVTVYIPPHGELRGGAWVVVDPQINPEQMEMYADVESRGGILEPAGAVDLLWKDPQLIALMHANDTQLAALDAQAAAGKDVAAQIAAREKALKPIYTQIATAYCDLHDKSGRMKAVGVIRNELEWKTSRAYLHWRIRRRLQEQQVVRKLRADTDDLSVQAAQEFVQENLAKAVPSGDDRAVAEFLETRGAEVDGWVDARRQQLVEAKIFQLMLALPADRRPEVVRDLAGFCKVNGTSPSSGSGARIRPW
jgi:acetyl-CoA carboxylase/biotin carboxylase 1